MDLSQVIDIRKTTGIDQNAWQAVELKGFALRSIVVLNAGNTYGEVGSRVTSSILWPLRDGPEAE